MSRPRRQDARHDLAHGGLGRWRRRAHYLTEHEGTDFGRVPNDTAVGMLGTMTTILRMLTDEVVRTI